MGSEGTGEVIDIEKESQRKEQSLGRRIIGWAGYLAVMAAILFFFAPESWWQFGVAPVSERRAGAAFTLRGMDGGEWNFGEKRGRVIVVNYWATWCPPCRIETPGLVRFANEFAPRGVDVVGVTLDEDLSLVAPFVESYQIKYSILLPGIDPNLPADGMALPTTFLYDKYGKLAKKYTGIVLESTLRSDVEELLAE